MENQYFSVDIIKAPFEATGIQVYGFEGVGGDNAIPHLTLNGATGNDNPVGSKGVRQLVEQKLRGTSAGSSGAAATVQSAAKVSLQPSTPMRIISRHKRGKLLEWDCDTHELVASCEHGVDTSVSQCIPTPTLTFTRIECAAGKDAMEEDHCIHAWDTHSLERRFTLRGHQGRVTAMAASVDAGRTILVTAGLDFFLMIWDVTTNVRTPTRRIECRQIGVVNHLATRGDFIVGSGANVAVAVWHLPTGELVASSPADTQSAVTAMRVTGGRGDTRFSVLTGTTDGFVREWRVELPTFQPASPNKRNSLAAAAAAAAAGSANGTSSEERKNTVTMEWQNKLHRANVEDVLTDGDVCISASAFDGVAFYHRVSGIKCSIMDEGGCRSVVLDGANKRVVFGSDKGVLCVVDCAAFAAGSSREVRRVWRCRPHNSAVTGLFLEVAQGNLWERVLSCSANGEVCVLDYSSTRSGRSRPFMADEQRWSTPVVLDDMGAVAVPKVNTGELGFVSLRTMAPSISAGSIRLEAPVTAMRWLDGVQKLLVGTSAGEIALYATQGPATWVVEGKWTLPSNSSAVHFSAPCDGFVTCCVEPHNTRADVSRVALLHLGTAPTVLSILPFRGATRMARSTKIVPGCPTRKESQAAYFVLTQFDDRSLQLVHCKYRAADRAYELIEGSAALPAQVLQPTFASAFAAEVSEHDYLWRPDLTSTLWRMTVLAVAPSVAAVRRAQWSSAGEVNEISPLDLRPLASKKNAAASTLGVTLVGQGGIDVVLTDQTSHEVRLLGEDGSVLYTVQHGGTVNYSLVPDADNRNRAISFTSTEAAARAAIANSDYAMCSAVSFNPVGRYIALAYRDGLVQLLDTSNKYIFARFWQQEREPGVNVSIRSSDFGLPRNGGIAQVHGQNSCVLTVSHDGVLSVHGLHKRVLLDRQSGFT